MKCIIIMNSVCLSVLPHSVFKDVLGKIYPELLVPSANYSSISIPDVTNYPKNFSSSQGSFIETTTHIHNDIYGCFKVTE